MFAPIFACLFGCGEQVNVAVEAAAGAQARAETHFILAASDPNVRPANPDFIALGKAVSRALTSQGFEEAKTPDAADLVVVIDWMVGEPKTVVRHAGGDSGSPSVKGAAPGGKGGMPLGGTSNYGALGFGMEATDRAELVYSRTVTLKGIDRTAYKSDQMAKPAWLMILTSDGDTDDVAKFAPPVMAAAIPYIATNAGKVRVRVGSTEDPVKYVRGDIPALPVKK